MNKTTLLFVEEVESTLSSRVLSRDDINVVLLRFKQNMLDEVYLDRTSNVPSFLLDKDKLIENEIERFNLFCLQRNTTVDHFYNDSEYNQETVQRFASLLGLSGSLSEKQALWVRDKVAMKDKLHKIGYRTMPYMVLASLENAVEFAGKNGGFPIIVKWRKGLSSKEVYKVESKEQLDILCLDYSTGRFMAEAYCPYLIWCTDALVQNGKIVTTFLTWLPYTNLSFAEEKDKFAQITVSKRPAEIQFDESQIAQDIVHELELVNGYLHLETFVDPEGQPIICEFAWRTAGEHMLLNHSVAFDIDVYSLLIDIMVGKKIDSQPLKGRQCVGDMFLPLTGGKVVKISSYDQLKESRGVIDGQINYTVGDVIQPKRQYTNCSGWLQIVGQTKDEVLRNMLEAYDKFEIITQ